MADYQSLAAEAAQCLAWLTELENTKFAWLHEQRNRTELLMPDGRTSPEMVQAAISANKAEARRLKDVAGSLADKIKKTSEALMDAASDPAVDVDYGGLRALVEGIGDIWRDDYTGFAPAKDVVDRLARRLRLLSQVGTGTKATDAGFGAGGVLTVKAAAKIRGVLPANIVRQAANFIFRGECNNSMTIDKTSFLDWHAKNPKKDEPSPAVDRPQNGPAGTRYECQQCHSAVDAGEDKCPKCGGKAVYVRKRKLK